MKKYLRYTLLIAFTIIFAGCDANLFMPYTVENKTKEEIKVFIPGYHNPINNKSKIPIDTALILKPGEKLIVDVGRKIDFPWARKNIYRKNPGKCGMQSIRPDTIIEIGCSKKEWKYGKRKSVFRFF